MDHHPVASLPEVEGMLPASHPLRLSSGNAQSLLVDPRDGIENQAPILLKQEPQYPIPAVKLGSNDGSDHGVDAGIAVDPARPYRHKVIIDPKRPFLQNPKYLEWLGRQRQEVGPNGKPVWSAEVEAAFQDALTHIPPMGRKKYSQRSRLFGRNMLIAEWILQATGEKRERKQVSSHIQVLDRYLKGIPEWDILIKPTRLSVNPSTGEGRKYYHNSIEHMVKQQKATRHRTRTHHLQRHRSSSNDDDSEWDASHLTEASDDNHLHRMNFEMWVSFPDQPEHALHKYTNLQTATETIMPMPLEELVDWRLSFPNLLKSIEEGWSSVRSEIVLLNTSFQLMDNFPPRHSKLGIGLELEFGAQTWKPKMSAPEEPKNWYSITYIYQNGEQVREPMCEKCIVSPHGQVRPVFQSRWWALTFTHLTEIKKHAEDSKDPIAIHSADDQVRGFFHGLTIMQEIWNCHGMWNCYAESSGINSGRRMAILLWKFSQAQAGFVGTTTWQKLIPPPHRLATNSPLPPASEMGLPPLALDTMMEDSPSHTSFDRNDHFLGEPSVPWDSFRTTVEDGVYPDSFMPFKNDGSPHLGQMAATFANPAGVDLNFDQLHETGDHNHFGLQDASEFDITSQEDHTIEANLFEMHDPIKEEPNLSHAHYGQLDHMPGSIHSPPISHDRPLARFDTKYHTVLQEQLSTDDPQQIQGHDPANELGLVSENRIAQAHVDEHDEALRSALLAVSSSDEVVNSQLPIIPHSPGHVRSPYFTPQRSLTSHWESPLVFRPSLQTHHSFPEMEYQPAADDTFGLISHTHSLLAHEPCLQSTFPGENGYLNTNSQNVDACAPTSTRTRSEPDLSAYQGAELDMNQLNHPSAAPRSQIQGNSLQADSLGGGQALGLFTSHGSDSPLQEQSSITNSLAPDFGTKNEADKGYAEVKMEGIDD